MAVFGIVCLSPQVIGAQVAKSPLPGQTRSEAVNQLRINRQELIDGRIEALNQLRERREEMVQERMEVREKLAERVRLIKDQRKQQVVLNIDDRMAKLNEMWTDSWTNTLTRLDAILEKIENKDPSLDTTDARKAIDTAQIKINTQAEKVYKFEINDEETLGKNVSTALDGFHSDLRAVRDSVFEARQAVRSVFLELKGTDEQ